MRIKLNNFYTILLLGLLNLPLLVHAQTFDINSSFPQQTTISGPGFFPFSTISNDFFQEQFPQNMNLEATFTSFLGGPCTIAPAADFAEIGSPFTVTGNSNFILDFSMASQNVSTFGLSFVPKGSPCTFNLQIMTLSTSSSPGSISTSSGGTVSKTNEELITEAISLETTVKNNLSKNDQSFEGEISNLELSLNLLNELSIAFSNNTTLNLQTLLQKKITCASEADNQIKEILASPSSQENIAKAKKLLRKALRCKKAIQKKI